MDEQTGERLDDASPLHAADLARHRAAYRHAASVASEAGGAPRLLDLGCGTGYGAVLLAARGHRVTALDRVRPAARLRSPAVRFVSGDLERLPFADGAFDLVASFQVIEHLACPRGYLRELARILAPDGQVLLTTPNRLQSDGENPFHHHEYTAAELASSLAPYFESVAVEGVHVHGPAARYHAERLRQIRRITRLDPLRLRHRLPTALVKWAFARLAVVVRLAARRRGALDEVRDEHHAIGPASDDCLDLLARCRGPRRTSPGDRPGGGAGESFGDGLRGAGRRG